MKGRKPLDPEESTFDWVAMAEEAGGLPPDPFPRVMSESGWGEVSNPTPNKLANTIHKMFSPKYKIAPDALVIHARRIYSAYLNAEEQMRPRNKSSSAGGADSQLKKIYDLSNKLAATISKLNSPATKALQRHGVEPQVLLEQLDRLSEDVRGAADDVEGTNEVGGRPPNYEAILVTQETARAYAEITGRQPTITRDPLTHEVRGLWPNLLKQVFATLSIISSVEDQVRKLDQ